MLARVVLLVAIATLLQGATADPTSLPFFNSIQACAPISLVVSQGSAANATLTITGELPAGMRCGWAPRTCILGLGLSLTLGSPV